MTESEEMYLVWIARIIEAGLQGPVPISQLAEQMQIQPVSVNQMVHKLETLGFVQYTPYQGVQLTTQGTKYAQEILHRRRLWEVFLVEHLHLPLEEADELACRMEHIFPTEALSRLDDFLGHPTRSPGDKRIPRTKEPGLDQGAFALETLELGCQGEVVTLDLDHTTRTFLKAEGLLPGIKIKVLARGGNGGMLVSTDSGNKLNLASELARNIWIRDPHR
ncbi:MAG: metal-dependent transcriptional regulator [Anaerolineales bacterium]|nr:metal-dependent transcriptional regulator [Anaerolineales bacterium]